MPAERALEHADDRGVSSLSDRDLRILALEGRTFRYVGAKERAIREQIGLSRTAYYVRLNALLDEPDALRAAPAVVNRLRRRRTSADETQDTHRADGGRRDGSHESGRVA